MPALADVIKKPDDPTQTGPLRRLGRWSEAKFRAFERGYGAMVAWSLRHWAVVLLLSLGILGVSAWRVLGLGVDFVMKDDYGVIQLTLELPEGTRLERTEEASDAISRPLRKYREVQMTFYSAGTTEGSLLSVTGGKEGSNIANIYARLVPKDKRRASDQEIADRIRAFVAKQYPKALLSVKMGNPIQTIFSGQEKPVTILVKGKNFSHLKQVAREVEARLKKVPGTKDVAAELLETKPDYRVVVDRDRAARLGLAALAIGGTLRAALHGWKVTEYRAEDSPLELVVRLRPEDRRKPEDLEQLMIPTFAEKHLTVGDTILHTGAPSYPLGQFAKVVPSRSPIERG